MLVFRPSDQVSGKAVASPLDLPFPRRCRRNITPAGFTLIEVLISLAVVSVGILGVIGLSAQSLQATQISRNTDSCLNMGADVIDRVASVVDNVTELEGAHITKGGCGTTDSNLDQLCRSMDEMVFNRDATLDITVDTDKPVGGVATITASFAWQYKGSYKRCHIVGVVPMES
jgi:type IV pilus modification protein PilV